MSDKYLFLDMSNATNQEKTMKTILRTKTFSFTWGNMEAIALLTVAKEGFEKRAYVVYVSPFGQFEQDEINLQDATEANRTEMARVVELIEAFCDANDYVLYSY